MTVVGEPRPGDSRPGAAPGELPVPSDTPHHDGGRAPTGTTGSPGRPRPTAARPRRDPRDEVDLADLDPRGLIFIGEHQTVLQGQLHESCYPGRSEAVVSRRVKRWLKLGLVGIMRFLGMGCNLLWLTERGARVLVDGGHATGDTLFPRARSIAPKDLRHQLTIVDLALLARRGTPFPATAVRPAWLLQRAHNTPPLAAVPDLLVVGQETTAGPKVLVAYEVDLGSEALKVFLPKLGRLSGLLPIWAGRGVARILVLTRGPGRREAIRSAVAGLEVPIQVELLPRETGRASLAALAKILQKEEDKLGK